jgi:hypothetical protein
MIFKSYEFEIYSSHVSKFKSIPIKKFKIANWMLKISNLSFKFFEIVNWSDLSKFNFGPKLSNLYKLQKKIHK